jgi:stage IV sporulation protein FB
MATETRPVSAQGLRFSLLGLPVLVRWTHFLLVLLVFWPVARSVAADPRTLPGFVPLFLMIPAAVLVHEVGHAVAARHFGGRPSIELVLFGGLTYPHLPEGTGPGPRAIVSVAGPLAGIASGALVWALTGGSLEGFDTQVAADLFVWAAAVWGGMNLVPLPGLDGGHVLDSFLELWAGSRGLRVAAVVKAATGVVVLVAVWAWLGTFAALWIVIVLGRTGVEEIRRGWEEPRIDRLRTALDHRSRGRLAEAQDGAQTVMEEGGDPRVREAARRIVVEVAAARGDWETVAATADAGREGDLLARALLASGRGAEAEAVARAIDGREGRQLLAQALVSQDLGHLVEMDQPGAAREVVDHAASLQESYPGTARRLAEVVAASPAADAGSRALALSMLGRPIEDLRPHLPPETGWLVAVEEAGRRDDLEALESLLSDAPSADVVAAAQGRLHAAGAHDAAVVVGRRALEGSSGEGARAVAYTLGRSLARAGRPREARDVLRSVLGDDLPASYALEPDLAPVRALDE